MKYYIKYKTKYNVKMYSPQGSKEDARDSDVLRRLRITNVLNCAGRRTSFQYNPYLEMDCAVQAYLELGADDDEKFPIIKLFYGQAKIFLDAARVKGEKTMVHCELGMNRSVTLCLAYKLDTNKCHLFQAIEDFVAIRPNILTNRGFRRQLVDFATDHCLI